MALIKIIDSIEYRFFIWMSQHPESAHAHDVKRFHELVLTICRRNTKKWKDFEYLKERILKKRPYFDKTRLDTVQVIFENLCSFYQITRRKNSNLDSNNELVSDGYYYEKGLKNGEIYQTLRKY